MKSIGSKIKGIRGKESRADFASRHGVHANTLLRWENGERSPDIEFLKQLIIEYKISPMWLLFGEGAMDATTEISNDPIVIDKPYYQNLLDTYNELRKQNSYLWPKVESLTKENGELRLEIERLKNAIK